MRTKDWKKAAEELAKRERSQPQETKSGKSGEERAEPESEEALFRREMQDVKPLSPKKSGREIIPGKEGAPSAPARRDDEAKYRQYLQDLVQGRAEFDIEFTNEYFQGNIKGLDSKIMQKLKAGQYSPQAHLDLHGLTSEEAWRLLVEFIKENFMTDKRCLLIIPGRGKNSPLGRSVLREQIQNWLTRDPLKRVLLAFSTAQPRHGGTGALYVLLRKYKKSQGKILWDRLNTSSAPDV
ncbi:MAG: Smr/MutS family protein [Desulfohalobiaceae bacterium]|nr:Smr/MutS family protein [Desulfohalobiaceae bacterium]